MRINQFIAHNSDFSRREADELIKQGLVKIGTKTAEFSDSVGENKVKTLASYSKKRCFISPKFRA